MTRPLFFTVWNYNLASPLITLQKCQNTRVRGPPKGTQRPSGTLTVCCFVLGKESRAAGWTSVGFSVLCISITCISFPVLKGFNSFWRFGLFVCLFVSWIAFFFLFLNYLLYLPQPNYVEVLFQYYDKNTFHTKIFTHPQCTSLRF